MPKLKNQNIVDANALFINAVNEGNSATVRDLIHSHGLSNCEAAYGSFTLLRDTINSGRFDTAKLLLEQGVKVNFDTDQVRTPLHCATEKGCCELVALLLDKNAPVDARNDQNETPLHVAVKKGYANIVKVLLDRNASMTAQTVKGSTPLFLALEQTHEKIFMMLLKHVFPSANEENNISSISVAGNNNSTLRILLGSPQVCHELITQMIKCDKSYNNIIDGLIDHGFVFSSEYVDEPLLKSAIHKSYTKLIENILVNNVDLINAKYTHCIVKATFDCQQQEIFRLIVNSGFDINAEFENGQLCICYMLCRMKEQESVKLIRRLLASGIFEETAPDLLHTAIEKPLLKVCEVLIENGTDVNSRNGYLETPLLLAVPDKEESRFYWPKKESKRNIDETRDRIVELLLNNRADVSIKSRRDGLTALHRAVKNGRKETVCVFLDFETDVNLQAKDGKTPLHLASASGHKDILEILLAKQANVNARAAINNATPLHLAARNGHTDVVARLCERGAETDARQENGWTPLHCAAYEQREAVMETLVGLGVDVNARGANNITPLHCCAMADFKGWRPGAMKILLENGCDINVETEKGLTASEIAMNKFKAHESSNANSDFCRDQYELVLDLQRRIVALQVAGLYVSERNLNQLCDSIDEFMIKDTEEDCKEDVNRMKEIKLNPQISLYDMLKNSNNLMYAKNKQLMESLRSVNLEEFAFYKSIICGNYKRNVLRLELMGSGQKSLDLLVKTSMKLNGTKTSVLPEELLELIVSYLDWHEIKCLIRCGEALKRQLHQSV